MFAWARVVILGLGKVITKTNQKKEKYHRSQWKREAEKSEMAKARKNASDQVLYLIG